MNKIIPRIKDMIQNMQMKIVIILKSREFILP